MALITCPKEYSSSQWGAVTTVSDVWEGTMAELLAHRDSIMGAYTTTQISPTKGGHGRLVASKQETGDVFAKWRGRAKLPAKVTVDTYLSRVRDGHGR